MVAEILYAETREDGREEIERFAQDYGAKYPKAGAGSRANGLMMAFKLLDMAQQRRRRVKVFGSDTRVAAFLYSLIQ